MKVALPLGKRLVDVDEDVMLMDVCCWSCSVGGRGGKN